MVNKVWFESFELATFASSAFLLTSSMNVRGMSASENG